MCCARASIPAELVLPGTEKSLSTWPSPILDGLQRDGGEDNKFEFQ